jgi:hypothetical protein
MTKMTLVWMLLSAVITSHIFFALNFDEKSHKYFGNLPEWAVYSIPIGYVAVVIWGGIEQISAEKENETKKSRMR